MENTATIEVNGKRYDALTGAVLGPSSAPLVRSGGRNIDGFFRARTTTTPRAATPQPIDDSIEQLPIQAPAAPGTAPTMHDVLAIKSAARPKHPVAARAVNHTRAHTPQSAKSRNIAVSHTDARSQTLEVRHGQQPNHVHHRAPQHSRTLRREAVPSPQLTTHNALRPKHALQPQVPSAIALKTPVANIDPERLARAQSTHQSPLITRHGRQSSLVPTFVPVAVQPLPTPEPPAPAPGSGGAPVPPPPQPNNKPDMFEQAITNANNYSDLRPHAAAYKKRARLHVASMAAGSLVLVIAAAFVAYQNSPALQLKVASVRSGVSSSLPNLATTGLTYTGAQAGDSRLTFGFEGAAGTFQLTQTNTNLSDAELVETIGSTDASGTPAYQTVLAGNIMVYRFSNTSATWISNGKWYTLSGNTAISDQQVKTIVQHI